MTGSYDLLNKNELRITDVQLAGADLTAVAHVAADVLDMRNDEVFVTDYLDNILTFDIMRPTIYPHQLLGRADELLAALSTVPGVHLSAESRVTSNGMLGWIAAAGEDERAVVAALAASEQIASEVDARIAKRVAVFSTGAELVSGDVKDTNWQAISESLIDSGFDCEHRGVLPDDEQLIAGSIRRTAEMGFGTIITTGGVGAEAKDCTVEAVLSLVQTVATRYTCHFTAGHGRHVKDGVRIAVGNYRGCRIVTLPGPNDEVLVSLPHITEGLSRNVSDDELATDIADALRGLLRARMNTGEHP